MIRYYRFESSYYKVTDRYIIKVVNLNTYIQSIEMKFQDTPGYLHLQFECLKQAEISTEKVFKAVLLAVNYDILQNINLNESHETNYLIRHVLPVQVRKHLPAY